MNEALVVFAREPRPGRVKTRLASGIGANAAATVYDCLLEHTLDVARRSGFELVVSLATAPESGWATRLGLAIEVQSGVDLGERLADAFRRRFGDGARAVVVIGSDSAQLKVRHLRAGFEALRGKPVVLGPAADGGYWLVGQRAPGVDLFSGVPWSRPTTLAATRARLRLLGVGWHELETLSDVDTAEDLRRALADPRIDAGLHQCLQAALTAQLAGRSCPSPRD